MSLFCPTPFFLYKPYPALHLPTHIPPSPIPILSFFLLIHCPMASPSQSVAAENPPRQSVERLAYSGRVALLLIAARADGGLGLVGERVAVGGWVKSFTVRPKSDAPRSPPQILPPAAVEGRDATCSEVLFKIPILRSIANMLGRGNEPTKHRGIKLALKKAMPSVAYLRINDGSCVANLQVWIKFVCSISIMVLNVYCMKSLRLMVNA